MLPAFFGIAFCYRYLLTDINVKRLHNRHELNYHAAVLTFKLLFYKQGGGSLGKVITPQKGFTTFKLGLFYKNVYYSSWRDLNYASMEVILRFRGVKG